MGHLWSQTTRNNFNETKFDMFRKTKNHVRIESLINRRCTYKTN